MVPSRVAHSQAPTCLVALAAEEDDLVAHGHRPVVAAVDHELVHGDGAGDAGAAVRR